MTGPLLLFSLFLVFISYLAVPAHIRKKRSRLEKTRLERDGRIEYLTAMKSIARYEKELAKPLSEVIAEARNRAIAEMYPIKRPSDSVITIIDLSDIRLYATREDQYIHRNTFPVPSEEELARFREKIISSFGVPPLIIYPPDDFRGITSNGIPVSGGGMIDVTPLGSRYPVQISREPSWLCRLRDQRLQVWEELKQLANREQISPTDADRWETLNKRLRILDNQIRAS